MEVVVSFMSQPLYPWGKSHWYPLDRRMAGPQSWSEHSGEERNIPLLPLQGIEHWLSSL